MYQALYSTMRLFYPGGSQTRRYLRELERLQWLSREELDAWQLARIQGLVKYAYEYVPYYRELYQRLNISPGDIKSLKDFQALPFLTREDVNNHLGLLVSSEFQSRVQQNATGGSTGEPMQFFIDSSFWWWNAAYEFRGRGWYGVREGDKIAWVWGAQRDFHESSWKARLKARILQHRYLNAFSMTEAKMQEFGKMLVQWKPVMFRAYASALSLFSQCIKEHHIEGIRPKLIETTAEKVTEPQRQLVEEVFRCKVADCYASRELGTIAYQCPEGSLHVCETRHLEIVADGKVAEPGEMGEVVITSLHQFAMPFIRYKIGDMAVCEHDRCACGRGIPVLREVLGRTGDFLVTSDGQLVHGNFIGRIFRIRPEVFRYQVIQPDKKHLEVRLVIKQKVDSAWLDKVRNELQTRFGVNMQISIRVVDDIKLTPAGKHRFIISEVKANSI